MSYVMYWVGVAVTYSLLCGYVMMVVYVLVCMRYVSV